MAGVLVAAGLLAAACSSSGSGTNSSSGGSATAGTTVTISNETGQLWTCGFNPYNGSTTGLSAGFVYEPLVFINPLQNGKTTPMLATSWKWGAGDKSLTFTIRKGVKFNDGTADDPGGRGVHLQPAEEVPGPGPARRLGGAVQRQRRPARTRSR